MGIRVEVLQIYEALSLGLLWLLVSEAVIVLIVTMVIGMLVIVVVVVLIIMVMVIIGFLGLWLGVSEQGHFVKPFLTLSVVT